MCSDRIKRPTDVYCLQLRDSLQVLELAPQNQTKKKNWVTVLLQCLSILLACQHRSLHQKSNINSCDNGHEFMSSAFKTKNNEVQGELMVLRIKQNKKKPVGRVQISRLELLCIYNRLYDNLRSAYSKRLFKTV